MIEAASGGARKWSRPARAFAWAVSVTRAKFCRYEAGLMFWLTLKMLSGSKADLIFASLS
ncbi:hypothetical protein BH20ACT14_BH20ACT14_02450 [soil metagenome]